MKITSKIKVHYLTYFFLFILCITGMFKNIIILCSIIVVHEAGHILFIKYFKYEIQEIIFLPFGGQTIINKDINSPLLEEFLIGIGGILLQLLFYIPVFLLFDKGYISLNNFIIFRGYFIAILIFNILPIISLDGSIIVKSVLEFIFPYKLANIINIIISFIFLFIFLLFNYLYNLNNYLIISFLLYKVINEIKYFKYYYNKFLLERYLKRLKRKKIKILNYNDLYKMHKEREHYFLVENNVLDERERLGELFDNKI